jgi:hypothetical protein
VPAGVTLSSSDSGRPSPISLVQPVDALGDWGPGVHERASNSLLIAIVVDVVFRAGACTWPDQVSN